jgi:hypothetical protein
MHEGIAGAAVTTMALAAGTCLGYLGITGLRSDYVDGNGCWRTGIAYRTFSVPLPKVRSAVMTAFDRMGIAVGSKEKIENGERFTAKASDREIEIELEAITPKTTRMRSTARSGIFRDAATATEIILQTERVLGGGA